MNDPHLTNDLLLDVLAGQGGSAARDHLATCAACREELDSLKPLRRDLEGLSGGAANKRDSGLAARIMKNLEQTARKRVYRRRVPVWRWVAGGAAAAVAVLAILLSVQRPTETPGEAETAVKLEPPPAVPAPKPEIPVPKPEPKPEPTPAPRPAPEPEPKPAPKPEPKTVPQPEPKPEPKPAPKPEPVKPRKAEPAKTEPKPVFIMIAKVDGGLDRRQEERWSAVEDEGETRWTAASALRARTQAARLTLADGSRITLPARSELRLVSNAPLTLALDRGRIYCEIPPEKGRDFRIDTPDAQVAVTGTRFSVRRNSDNTQVIVSDGEVSVTNALGESRVPAGTGLIVRKTRVPGTPQVVDADRMLAWGRAAGARARSLYRFDFENGKRPYPWTSGTVAAGPPRGVNRHCLKVDADSIGADLSRIDKRHSVYRKNLVVRVRYYATGGKEFWVQFFSRKHKDNFRYQLRGISTDKWETFELPLSELYLLNDKDARLADGDLLTWLSLGVSGATGPVYFDDIELVEDLSR